MFRKSSVIACVISLIAIVAIRWVNIDRSSKTWVNVISWDAMGYYMYLPGAFIYHDIKSLEWYKKIDAEYHPTGAFYQAHVYKNGNYVMKYLMGIAILYSPFFFIAHYLAPHLGYAQDGFSVPYQLAVCFASMFYSFLALLVLRKVLLRYYSEGITAISLLLMVLATNFLQYAAVDCGLTHSYLFALFAFQIMVTIKWYEAPAKRWAFLSGLLIGVAAITRPTDGIMLLIPLLWSEYSRESSRLKWAMVKAHASHIFYAAAGGIIGVVPQLVYWKYVTGNWVYDVGSKWVFFNPWWRQIFGFEKGWVIYTPIVIFFALGLFLLNNKPFKRAVIVFFILNTWIIISWFEWRGGGTYSCRYFVQGYPVLILPFAAVIEWCLKSRGKYFFVALWIYLLGVNIFQLYQYNTGIIRYDENNRKYYAAIYLNPCPTPLDMSLLDTDERLKSEEGYDKKIVFALHDTTFAFNSGTILIAQIDLHPAMPFKTTSNWIKVEMEGVTYSGLWQSFLVSQLPLPDTTIIHEFRMSDPLNKEGEQTRVAFYQQIPANFSSGLIPLYIKSEYGHNTRIKKFAVTYLSK